VDIDPATRAAVRERDNYQCQACGTAIAGGWYSVQHRVARGTGGAGTPDNLVLLCGSATSPGCHRRCEDRDPVMHARGFWLNSWESPADIPVAAFGGQVRYLAKDGTWSFAREGNKDGLEDRIS